LRLALDGKLEYEVHEEIGTGAYLTSVIGFTASFTMTHHPRGPTTMHNFIHIGTTTGTLNLALSFQSGFKFSQLKTERVTNN
jgi:hypothetical protein